MARVKSILNSMGRVYLASKDHKESLALFQQSLEIARDMGDHVGEAEVLGDLGDLHISLEDVPRASELYRRALNIAKESNDRRKESENLNRLGDLYLAQNDTEQALGFYQEALEAVRRYAGSYDLLITDMTMPNLTGAELAEQVMEIDPVLPVILCTGHSELINRRQAMTMGIREYCEKPISLEQLLRSVRRVLDGQQ